MALRVHYDGKDFDLDLEDMDMDQGRAMERFGVPNLRALEEGIESGDLDALTVAYWVMLQQNGEPGARLERVTFKPLKFIVALVEAALKEKERLEAEAKARGEDPKDNEG